MVAAFHAALFRHESRVLRPSAIHAGTARRGKAQSEKQPVAPFVPAYFSLCHPEGATASEGSSSSPSADGRSFTSCYSVQMTPRLDPLTTYANCAKLGGAVRLPWPMFRDLPTQKKRAALQLLYAFHAVFDANPTVEANAC